MLTQIFHVLFQYYGVRIKITHNMVPINLHSLLNGLIFVDQLYCYFIFAPHRQASQFTHSSHKILALFLTFHLHLVVTCKEKEQFM